MSDQGCLSTQINNACVLDLLQAKQDLPLEHKVTAEVRCAEWACLKALHFEAETRVRSQNQRHNTNNTHTSRTQLLALVDFGLNTLEAYNRLEAMSIISSAPNQSDF